MPTAPIVYPYPIQRDLYHWPTFSGAEFARRLAGLAAQLVDPLPHQERAQSRGKQAVDFVAWD